MSESKKYYWIKLKATFFDEAAIDWLLAQKNGCEYVVLYQMLCVKTVNANGTLSEQIGEIIVPYDVDKIVRDTKHFSRDTVVVALELYKKLGLIYQSDNGSLVISDFDNMVGSSKLDDHTKLANAERQRRFREKKKQEQLEESVTVTETETLLRNGEYRDKSLDIKSIDIDKDKDISINNSNSYKSNVSGTRKTKVFQKPSNQDVLDYCNSIGHGEFDIEKFIDYYESNGWKVGKNPMKDWKAAVRNWIRKAETEQKNNAQKKNDEERGFWF